VLRKRRAHVDSGDVKPMLEGDCARQIRVSHMVARHEVRGTTRSRMTGLDLRGLVEVECDGEIGLRVHPERNRIRNIPGAGGNGDVLVPGEG